MLRVAGTTETVVTWRPDGQETLNESHRKPEEGGVGIVNSTPYLTTEETEAQKDKDSGRRGTQQDHLSLLSFFLFSRSDEICIKWD